MVDISFCTTALNRPEILEQTYHSFSNNIDGLDFKKYDLWLNIDPIVNTKNILLNEEIAKRFFNKVHVRIPDEPNFPKAINWCWSQANTQYIFHLEDDWILNGKINFNNIVDLFKTKNALEVILKAYQYKYDKLALSPSIWHYDLYKTFAGKLNENINPECQLRDKKFAYGFNISNIKTFGQSIITNDIGRNWLKQQKLIKPGKSNFVRY